jgi:hypothetical protein
MAKSTEISTSDGSAMANPADLKKININYLKNSRT